MVLALAFGSLPAGASDISDLASTYSGAWHSTTSAANEDLPSGLTIVDTSANGKFTGFLGDQFIAGKVSSKGVITFKSGQARPMRLQPQGGIVGTAKISKGKAQLSATGQFIVGTFTYKGTGGLASLTGNYLFSLGIPAAAGAGTDGQVGTSARPEDLGARYLGRAHHSTLAATENSIFDFADITRASNGKITATVTGVPVTGKVNRSGKVTFKGRGTVEGGTYTATGAGQLSATGKFFLGSAKSKGTGAVENQTGKFTFESTETTGQPLSVSGESLGRAR